MDGIAVKKIALILEKRSVPSILRKSEFILSVESTCSGGFFPGGEKIQILDQLRFHFPARND